MKDVSIKLV